MKRKRSGDTTPSEVARPDQGESDSDFGSEMLRITINDWTTTTKKKTSSLPRTKTYHVHKSRICKESPYFAALKNFNEGQVNHVTLDDISHRAFRQILNWVYAGSFLKSDDLYGTRTLIETWVAADRFLMRMCKNMAMDELRARLAATEITITSVKLLNDLEIPTNTAIVQFVLDQFVYDSITGDSRDHEIPFKLSGLRHLTNDMQEGIAYRIWQGARDWHRSKQSRIEAPVDPASGTGCWYHEHDYDIEGCYFDENTEWPEKKIEPRRLRGGFGF